MLGFNGGLIGKARDFAITQSLPGVWTAPEQVKASRVGQWPGGILVGLHFFYSDSLLTSLAAINVSGTVLGSGVTIPSNKYVYMTWRGVNAGSGQYQLQNSFGVSTSSVSAPYLVINGAYYPTTGSYGTFELPRMYFSNVNAFYVYNLNAEFGVFSTGRDNTPDAGWGAGGSITYTAGSLG